MIGVAWRRLGRNPVDAGTYRAPVTSSYCAPCIADLALVRDAVTSVSGTAACMAHAVLLTHSTDDPARRRQRLDALRDLATGKAETAEPAEQVKLELLVQEYGLAGAMDMGGPSRRQGGQQRPQRAGAGGQGARRAARWAAGGTVSGRAGAATVPAVRPRARPVRSVRASRGRGRGRGEHAEGGGRDRRPSGVEGETAPVTPAPGPAGEATGGAVERPRAAGRPRRRRRLRRRHGRSALTSAPATATSRRAVGGVRGRGVVRRERRLRRRRLATAPRSAPRRRLPRRPSPPRQAAAARDGRSASAPRRRRRRPIRCRRLADRAGPAERPVPPTSAPRRLTAERRPSARTDLSPPVGGTRSAGMRFTTGADPIHGPRSQLSRYERHTAVRRPDGKARDSRSG